MKPVNSVKYPVEADACHSFCVHNRLRGNDSRLLRCTSPLAVRPPRPTRPPEIPNQRSQEITLPAAFASFSDRVCGVLDSSQLTSTIVPTRSSVSQSCAVWPP
jgi:hypothetical protein